MSVPAAPARSILHRRPVLPSGYVVPEKVEPETPEETADSSLTDEETPQAAPAEDTTPEEIPLTDPARMTANEDREPHVTPHQCFGGA